MKTSFKFLTIGLALVLLVMSQLSLNRTASAVTSIDQDTVEFLNSSRDVVTYYKPGDTAAFFIADTDLQTTKTGTATWTTLNNSSTVFTLPTGAVTGAATSSAATFLNSATSTASDAYSTTKFATTTPLTAFPTATVAGTGRLVTEGSLTDGTFTLVSAASAGQTVVASYTYHIQDVFAGDNTGTVTTDENRAKVVSTSDSNGEWVTISEVQGLGLSTLSATTTIFRGAVDLSADAGKVAAGDGAVWVQDGDTLTVTYYSSDHTTVKDTTTAKIDATVPTVASISPADGSVIASTVPNISFTITDGGSGLSTSDPGSNVAVTINGCPVLDSELGFPSRTTAELKVNYAPTGTANEWSDASSPSCAARTSLGFDVNTTTLGNNHHGVAFQWKIVATDVAGNSKTIETTDLDLTVDTVAPDMTAATAGKGWDSANKTSVAQANSIQVTFNESLDPSSVAAADFKVDGVAPSEVLVTGVNNGTKLENELVFLTLASNLSGSSRPKVELTGSVKDTAGNELKPATGQTVADSIAQAADGVAATLSGITFSAQILAKDAKSDIAFTSDENLTAAADSLASGCTCLSIGGGNASSTPVTTKGTVTLVTPKKGEATFLQSAFPTTGIYGVVINGRDLGANNTPVTLVTVTNEDISSNFTSTGLAANTAKVIEIENWPIADSDADGSLADSFSVTIDGTAATTTAYSIDWGDDQGGANTDDGNGTATLSFTAAIAAGAKVLLSYSYVSAGQTMEVDTSAPKISFDPTSGSSIENQTPFITIKFDDIEYAGDTFTKATVTKATLTDPAGTVTNIIDLLSTSDSINYVYLPAEKMALGTWTLTARGKDEAGNESTDLTGTFTITARAKRDIDLRPGWNLISLPAEPASPAINDVVTAAQIDTVLSYDPKTAGKWLTAVRGSDGKLSGTLTTITASRAYWVHTTTFDPISVDLPGLAGGSQLLPPSIALVKGWNLVPVVTLDSTLTGIDKDKYFAGLKWSRAYGFDTAKGTFTAITPDLSASPVTTDDTDIKVEKGYWVFTREAGDLVP